MKNNFPSKVVGGGGGLLVGGGLLERVGLIEDVWCAILYISFPLLGLLRQRLFLIIRSNFN